MTTLESLEQAARDQNIALITHHLPVKGFYYASEDFAAIALSAKLETACERCTILAHELGHYHTHPPDLFLVSESARDKYEHMADVWAAKTLLPVRKLIAAWQRGIRNVWDLAEYLDVTPDFINKSIDILEEQYGEYIYLGDVCLYFRPLEVRLA